MLYLTSGLEVMKSMILALGVLIVRKLFSYRIFNVLLTVEMEIPYFFFLGGEGWVFMFWSFL